MAAHEQVATNDLSDSPCNALLSSLVVSEPHHQNSKQKHGFLFFHMLEAAILANKHKRKLGFHISAVSLQYRFALSVARYQSLDEFSR
jgi:hypothetical protein